MIPQIPLNADLSSSPLQFSPRVSPEALAVHRSPGSQKRFLPQEAESPGGPKLQGLGFIPGADRLH